jgi:hypothetical protein
MRKSGVFLALLWSAVGSASVLAADYSVPALKAETYQPPSWAAPRLSVVGSMAPTWTNNAFFSRDDRKSDWFFNGDVAVRMDGRFTPDLAYRLYTRTEIEPFAREKDANVSLALWGGRLTQNVMGWSASAIYENRYAFDGIYGERLFTAHDVKAALSRSFTVGSVILSPFVQGRYRFSGLPEAEYWRLDAALGIEVPLNERWSITSSPFFEAYWFTGGLNSGREDQIYSGSIGVKYNVTPSVSVSVNVAYEERISNVAERKYQNIDIGPRLDFAF